jgi:peptidoglycan-associated lipoprotein
MRLKLISILAASFFVAACSTPTEETGETAGTGASSGSSSPTTAAASTLTETSAASADKAAGSSYAVGSQESLIAEAGDRVFFGFDKFELNVESREALRRQAAWLRSNPDVTIVVEGHADERGTRDYNLALGERRATAARDYLVALGLNANRIRVISYGKERPDVLGSNDAAWAANRRAVTVVDVNS